MLTKLVIAGVAAMAIASVSGAQERGTMEFGAFGSGATFDNSLGLRTGYGGGGRVGMYLDPRWTIEFEDAEMRARRTNGLADVNVGILSGRLVGVPFKTGRLSFLLGGGAGVSTETNFMHTYGVDALAGVKIDMGKSAAFRVDGVMDWLANQNWKTYRSIRAGVSLYRRPAKTIQVVTVTGPAAGPTEMVHSDSVSALEIARLRAKEAALRALRDSLSAIPASSRSAERGSTVYFDFDKATLTHDAKAILDSKLAAFKTESDGNIEVVGYTDLAGSSAYNLGLGERRAMAVRDYLVAGGISQSRIVVKSMGKNDPVTRDDGKAAQAPNRRVVFWVLIAQ